MLSVVLSLNLSNIIGKIFLEGMFLTVSNIQNSRSLAFFVCFQNILTLMFNKALINSQKHNHHESNT